MATGVEAPFEDVAFDGDGSRDFSVGLALGCGSDVDEDGSGALRRVGFGRLDALQPGAGGGEGLVDAPRTGRWSVVVVHQSAPARSTVVARSWPSAMW